MAAALTCTLVAGRAQAQAVDACGAVASDGSVQCAGAGNPYRRGISYETPAAPDGSVLDLTVVLDADVAVEPGRSRPIRAAVDLTGHLDASVTLHAVDGSSVRTNGTSQAGVRIVSEGGDIDIMAPAIRTTGEQSEGIIAWSTGDGDVSIAAPSVRTRGSEAPGVFAVAENGGDLSIVSGSIRTRGDLSAAIEAYSPLGTVRIEAADLQTRGHFSDGIVAMGQSVLVSIAGKVMTEGVTSHGAYLRATGGEAQLLLDGGIRTNGAGSVGVDIIGETGAMLTGSGGIRVEGDLAVGADIRSAHGDAVIDLAHVSAIGISSAGALASSTHGDAWIRLGTARATGDYMPAVSAGSGSGTASVVITGSARADGMYGAAVVAASVSGRAEVDVQDALSTGHGGSAILTLGKTVAVTVNGSAVSRGGADAGGIGATILALGAADAEGVGGDVLVTNNGRVVARGDDTAALLVRAAGAVAIQGSGRFVTHGANGTGIDVEAGGDIAIDIGEVRTTGDGALGVRAQAGGDIDFRAGRIVTEGANASGVQLTTTSDHGAIRALRTAGERSFGINLAGGQSLDAAVTAGSIATAGDRSSGIRIARNNGGEANLTIEAGSIITSGTVADGITLITDNVGQATIRAGRLEVSGLEAGGIYAAAEAMDLDLTVGSARASGQGSAGVVAMGANVTLHSTGTIASTGENGRGIAIVSGRDADLTIEGDVTATGDRSTAVAVQTNAADGVATVNMTGDIVTSGYFTTGFSAGGEGSVVANLNNVTNNGTGLSAYAILVTPAGDADVTVHNVTARGFTYNSTYVRSREGDASLAVTGLYKTEVAGGIYVDALGRATLSVNDMVLEGYDVSAVVMTGGDVDLAIRGTIDDHVQTALRDAGPAIQLVAGGGTGTGLATVGNDGTINTYADTRSALSIVAQDTAMLTGTGSIHTRGAFATAVTMRADTGGILLEQGKIVTEGDLSSGAVVTGSGDVAVDLDHVATGGWSAGGVDIRAGGQVTADIGAIETKGAQSGGLRISTLGGIDAVIGSISTAGNRSTALQLAADGDVDIGVEGQLATVGNQAFGVFAVTAGDLSIAAADIRTLGALSRGVFADVGGDALLRHGTISTSGAGADGINLVAEGAVDIELGTVATRGAGADGIDVQAGGAVRAVVGSASASGADARAINITGQGSVALEVAQGGDVRAANDAILLSSGAGSVLANHGTISADSGAAIRASGGSATIRNGGAITGRIVLTDAADLVTNSGTMRLTGAQFGAGDDRLVNHGDLVLAGDLDFGDGNDTLANHGTLSLAGAATAGSGLRALAVGPVTRSIAGLNGFANTGLVDLRSGVAGDVLDISGGFTGSGDSTVALDARFGGVSVADRLDIDGAATGSTRIVIHPLDAPTALHAGTVLVRAGAGTQADAFRLDAPASGGFFASGLAFDAATTSFRLVTTPSGGAYRLLKLSEGARSVWLESSDMIAAHLAGQGNGFWFTAGGNVATRDQTRRFEGFGFAQDVALGYAQDSFSTQFGYGVGSGAVTLGVTAGYGNSTLAFDDSADRVEYDALNAGLYATVRSGRFYANALAKYDHYDIGVSFQSIGEKAATNGSAVGGRIEAGVRLGSARFHAEPRVSLSYQHVAIDPLALSADTRFHDWDSGRATAGLRVASILPLAAAELRIYAEADYVKALGAGAGLVFATGAVMLGAEDGRFPDHGAGKLGFEVSRGRTSGFVEAVGRHGGQYRGGGARAGLRIAF